MTERRNTKLPSARSSDRPWARGWGRDRRSAWPAFGLALAVGWVAGCARDEVVAFVSPGSDPGADGGSGDGGSADGGPSLTCARPPIITGEGEALTCGSAIAERTFRFAMCSCSGLSSTHAIQADAFESSVGPYSMPGGRGGSLGLNGELSTNAPLTVSGSLWIAGASGLQLSSSEARLDVGHDLAVAGAIGASAAITVGRDARVGGRLAAPGFTAVGSVTVPEGQSIEVPGGVVASALVRAPVVVAAPCACEDAGLLDIARIVERQRTDNDNAAFALSPELLGTVNEPLTLELPCGRFYFRRIAAAQRLRISVVGRASVFIGENVQLDSGLEVELGPDAELDLFVAGTFSSSGRLDFGSFRTPTRARLFVGGAGTLQQSGGGTFAGQLYAPRSELVISAPLEVFGSAFVRRLSVSAPVQFHYDVSVLEAGQACTAPRGTACSTCGDCPSSACFEGECRACGQDADCCAPLFCVGGRCAPSPP